MGSSNIFDDFGVTDIVYSSITDQRGIWGRYSKFRMGREKIRCYFVIERELDFYVG